MKFNSVKANTITHRAAWFSTRPMIVLLVLAGLTQLCGCKTTFLQITPKQAELSQPTTVPLDMRSGLPIVSVLINGQGPYRLLLDTGAEITCLNRRVMRELNLPPSDYKWQQFTTSSGKLNIKSYKHIQTMTIGNAQLKNLDAMEIGITSDVISQNIPIDGLLSVRVFYNLLMTIDYQDNQLTIAPYQSIPLNSPNTYKSYLKYSIHQIVDLKVGHQTMPFIIDSGSSMGFCFLNHPGNEVTWIREPRLTHAVQTVYGKNSNVYKGQIRENIQIGETLILSPAVYNIISPDFIMAGPDQKKIIIKERTSLLGADVLKLFNVTFDQRAEHIRFKPNSAVENQAY
ncbi:MAG TPA: hypothetical protein DCM28_18965 [Phycisphaerales bacterium]|nr:hypothetical protein [Phycisphaerales bacterium]HCD32000.1 hypothetical protein [Phycisphaerales bacterium]